MRFKILVAMISLLAMMPMVSFAASTSYYAKSPVYFTVPSDATFQIAMPSDYTSFTAITGENEGAATAVNWISFNFSTVPQAALQVPYETGASGNAQTNIKPIFYVDNTGNVAESFKIYVDASLATGLTMFVNATCASCTSPLTALTVVGVTSGSANTLTTSLANTDFLNITLFANASSSAASGTTSKNIYIYSTAV